MDTTFKYEPVYNQPGNFEVLFKPSRKIDWANPNRSAWRRFALCTNESDAKTLCAAMNKWDADGNDWIRELPAPMGKLALSKQRETYATLQRKRERRV